MRAGLLKEPITILQPHIITNEYGEETTEYLHKYATRARVTHSGGNRVENIEIYLNDYRDFQIRIYVDICDYDRIEWDGKQYRILSIDRNKEQQNITIKTERVND